MFEFCVGLEAINVDVERVIDMYRLGVIELGEVLKDIVSEETYTGLNNIITAENFSFNDDLWVRTIYDYALAYHKKTMNVEHILKTLTPLYLGKVASLIMEMEHSSAHEVEERLEALCKSFEGNKQYLIEKWG